MKIILYILLASLPKDEAPPNRDNVPPAIQKILREKDNDPNGWKFDLWEWKKMVPPKYYKHPTKGSNGGYAFA